MISFFVTVCNWISVVGSTVLKVPQLWQLLSSSADTGRGDGNDTGRGRSAPPGVSLSSVVLETFYYSVILFYHVAHQLPLLSYLEYTLLVPQDLVLLALVLHRSGRLRSWRVTAAAGAALAVLAAALINAGQVPTPVVRLLFTLSLPAGFSSKLVQLAAILLSGDSRGVSQLTWSLAAVTCVTRLVTTACAESVDPALLTSFAVSLTLNCAIVAATRRYSAAPRVSQAREHTPHITEQDSTEAPGAGSTLEVKRPLHSSALKQDEHSPDSNQATADDVTEASLSESQQYPSDKDGSTVTHRGPGYRRG